MRPPKFYDCNRLSPKCKSQLFPDVPPSNFIVTDYRLNANHNYSVKSLEIQVIVTDYRLNANHNQQISPVDFPKIVTDYRLNANHN